MSGSGVPDFLALRKGFAAQNEVDLAASGIQEAAAEVTSAKPSTTSTTSKGKTPGRPKGSTNKKRKADDVPGEPRMGTRRSNRTATQLVNAKDEEERLRIEAEAQAKAAEEAARFEEEQRIAKHGDREIEAQSSVIGASDTASLRETLKELAALKLEETKEDPELGKRPALGTKKLQEKTKDLELRAIVKVIPERIYSMTVHPDPQRDLVFVGDKTGHLSLWDCTNAGKRTIKASANGSIRDGAKPKKMDEDDEEGAEGEAEEDEYQWGKWWVWQGHMAHSVSGIKFRPNETKQVYSSSYDCTVRTHHFERGISEEVIDADVWGDEALIHAFDFDATGNEIWASDNNGGLIFRDLREPKENAKRWDVDGHKIGCVSLNPANPRLAVTAHLKRYMRLWDLSLLRGLPTDTPTDEILDKALLHEYAHEKACSAAYFDPTGTRVASTSYDDAIRVWDVDPKKTSDYPEGGKWKPSKKITHNCQVGRYVTVLRAHWSTVPSYPPHLHIGNMARTLDVLSPDGTAVKHFTNDAITAVPAVTASHPTVGGKFYGGAASGKVSFWTEPLNEDDDEEEEKVKGEAKKEEDE
ncbi:hypothetical protein JCM6882_007932 [Rhodosporidiobolus microsporus]